MTQVSCSSWAVVLPSGDCLLFLKRSIVASEARLILSFFQGEASVALFSPAAIADMAATLIQSAVMVTRIAA